MSVQHVHVVLIETASNQDFVFQSNKLRDVVGASDLITRVGTQWAIEAAASLGGPRKPENPIIKDRVDYLNTAPRFGAGSTPAVEPVVCTSGKAVFLVRDQAVGEDIVYCVTRRALEEAPGLTVRGAVSRPLSLDAPAEDAGRLVEGLFKEIERLRLDLPPTEARFPFQPMVAPCDVTGLPAEGFVDRGPEPVLLAATSIAKRKAAKPESRPEDDDWTSYERAEADLELNGLEIARNPRDLEDSVDWLAVVHADGNGFGQVFLNLADYCKKDGKARDYFDLYRELSVSLDLVGVAALKAALPMLGTAWFERRRCGDDGRWRETSIKGIPLAVSVMGGDDLTVICDGSRAVQFTKAYLAAFERLVEEKTVEDNANVIPTLVHKCEGKKDFGAAAGVAIVKPHHPLHRAFELAEALTKSAKSLVKEDLGSPGLTALDFQVVYGDTSSSLQAMRKEWKTETKDGTTDEVCLAYARPYVVSHQGRRAHLKDPERFDLRHFATLEAAVAQLRKRDQEGRPLFPRSQQHELREAVLAGRAIADARLKLIATRYTIDWTAFGGTAPGHAEPALFVEEDSRRVQERTEITWITRLLDAMDLVDIDPKRDTAGSQPTPDVAASGAAQ